MATQSHTDVFNANDGLSHTVTCGSTNYTTAISGGGTKNTATYELDVGQDRDALGNYTIWQYFIQFNTASIPASASITSVQLVCPIKTDASDTDFFMGVEDYDWGGVVSTSNFRPYTALPASPTFGSESTFSHSGGIDITDTSGFSYLNLSGYTRFMVYSDRQRSANQPITGTDEYAVHWVSSPNYPYLVVKYTTVTEDPEPEPDPDPESNNYLGMVI